jgi:enterochelin esterase-like enzyme
MKVKQLEMTCLIAVVLTLVTLMGSCGRGERELPEGDNETVRYQTDLRMRSSVMGFDILYSVYLPEDYNEAIAESYPVVYLLHGIGSTHQDWNDAYLNVSSLVSTMERTKGLQKMIYVMPQGFSSYYVNRYDGSSDYMDMFTDELVPFIDKTYRTVANREHRAAVGFSMGGYGAFILPSKHPELFSVSVPLSMSWRTDAQYMTEGPQSGWDNQWGKIFGGKGKSGAARLTDYYKENNPFYMFTPSTTAEYASIHYWMDCGDDEEQLLVCNDDIHVLMRSLNMPHEYRVRNGAHTSSYWRGGTMAVLPYIQACFNGQSWPSEESYTPPASYTALHSTATLAGLATDVYLPADYAANPDKRYPVLYLIYGTESLMTPENAMKTLSPAQKAKPFIMVATESWEADLAEAVDATYRTLAASANRTAIGVGQGGGELWTASLAENFPISSLFLLDAAIPADAKARNSSVYYYCSLPDEGTNYEGANTFYKLLHSLDPAGETFQYRVYNGEASANSMLYGLDQMRSDIQTKIKTN